MAAHARLKNEFTEDEKCHNLMSWLIFSFQSKVEKIIGHAVFVDNETVEVNGEKIKAKHILIATGGRPILPTIPGGEHAISSDGFFELEDLPK